MRTLFLIFLIFIDFSEQILESKKDDYVCVTSSEIWSTVEITYSVVIGKKTKSHDDYAQFDYKHIVQFPGFRELTHPYQFSGTDKPTFSYDGDRNVMITFVVDKPKFSSLAVGNFQGTYFSEGRQLNLTNAGWKGQQKTCHHNYSKRLHICIWMDENLIKKFMFSVEKRNGIVNVFQLQTYLEESDIHSFSNRNGEDFLVTFQKGKWIYVMKLEENLYEVTLPFVQAYQINFPNGFKFSKFIHADETGCVLELKHGDDREYFYSVWNEVSAMKLFCIPTVNNTEQKPMHFAIFANKLYVKPARKGPTAALRSFLGFEEPLNYEFPWTIFIIFICTSIYFFFFLSFTFVSKKPPSLADDMKIIESHVSKLSPIIETTTRNVHGFLKKRCETRP